MTVEQIHQKEIDDFMVQASEALRPFFITDETRQQVEASGSRIEGHPYFEDFFKLEAPDNGINKVRKQLVSAYVGSTALGIAEIGNQSLSLLEKVYGYTHELERELVRKLGEAARAEHKAQHITRAMELQKASKQLGKWALKTSDIAQANTEVTTGQAA